MSADPERGFRPLARPAHADVAKDGPSAIVVGYDGSDPARSAMAAALGLARRSQAYLYCVFVGMVPALTAATAQAAGPAEVSIRDEYDEICRDVHTYLAELGVAGECVRRNGEPAYAIEELAEQVQADLIVVGRSKSRAHAVIGSVAVHLVKHAGRPVVVVP